MEGPLTCACGSTDITIHKVRFVSGWEPKGRVVETTLTTRLRYEDENTLVSQREVSRGDKERAAPDLAGICCQVQISFYCINCKSFASKLSVTVPEDHYRETYIDWKPIAKKAEKI